MLANADFPNDFYANFGSESIFPGVFRVQFPKPSSRIYPPCSPFSNARLCSIFLLSCLIIIKCGFSCRNSYSHSYYARPSSQPIFRCTKRAYTLDITTHSCLMTSMPLVGHLSSVLCVYFRVEHKITVVLHYLSGLFRTSQPCPCARSFVRMCGPSQSKSGGHYTVNATSYAPCKANGMCLSSQKHARAPRTTFPTYSIIH